MRGHRGSPYVTARMWHAGGVSATGSQLAAPQAAAHIGRGGHLLEFDPEGVVAALVDILDRVRALGFHPARLFAGRG